MDTPPDALSVRESRPPTALGDELEAEIARELEAIEADAQASLDGGSASPEPFADSDSRRPLSPDHASLALPVEASLLPDDNHDGSGASLVEEERQRRMEELERRNRALLDDTELDELLQSVPALVSPRGSDSVQVPLSTDLTLQHEAEATEQASNVLGESGTPGVDASGSEVPSTLQPLSEVPESARADGEGKAAPADALADSAAAPAEPAVAMDDIPVSPVSFTEPAVTANEIAVAPSEPAVVVVPTEYSDADADIAAAPTEPAATEAEVAVDPKDPSDANTDIVAAPAEPAMVVDETAAANEQPPVTPHPREEPAETGQTKPETPLEAIRALDDAADLQIAPANANQESTPLTLVSATDTPMPVTETLGESAPLPSAKESLESSEPRPVHQEEQARDSSLDSEPEAANDASSLNNVHTLVGPSQPGPNVQQDVVAVSQPQNAPEMAPEPLQHSAARELHDEPYDSPLENPKDVADAAKKSPGKDKMRLGSQPAISAETPAETPAMPRKPREQQLRNQPEDGPTPRPSTGNDLSPRPSAEEDEAARTRADLVTQLETLHHELEETVREQQLEVGRQQELQYRLEHLHATSSALEQSIRLIRRRGTAAKEKTRALGKAVSDLSKGLLETERQQHEKLMKRVRVAIKNRRDAMARVETLLANTQQRARAEEQTLLTLQDKLPSARASLEEARALNAALQKELEKRAAEKQHKITLREAFLRRQIEEEAREHEKDMTVYRESFLLHPVALGGPASSTTAAPAAPLARGGAANMDTISETVADLESLNLALVYTLDAPSHDMTRIPCSVYASNVRNMLLAGNRLTHTKGVHYLEKLRYLDLSNNLFETIDLGEMVRLVYLNMSHNQLKTMQRVARGISLRYVNVHGNPQLDLMTLRDLEQLQVLGIGPNNRLRGESLAESGAAERPSVSPGQLLGRALGHLRKLLFLELNSNHLQLEAVQDLGGGGEMLQGLCLNNNDLSALPGLVGSRKALYELSMVRNKLQVLRPSAMVQSLHILKLDFNQIRSLAPLGALPFLTELYLSNNALFDIQSLFCLCVCQDLEVLDLRQNAVVFDPDFYLFVAVLFPRLSILNNVPIAVLQKQLERNVFASVRPARRARVLAACARFLQRHLPTRLQSLGGAELAAIEDRLAAYRRVANRMRDEVQASVGPPVPRPERDVSVIDTSSTYYQFLLDSAHTGMPLCMEKHEHFKMKRPDDFVHLLDHRLPFVLNLIRTHLRDLANLDRSENVPPFNAELVIAVRAAQAWNDARVSAALMLQTLWRGLVARRAFLKARRLIVSLQRRVSQRIAQRRWRTRYQKLRLRVKTRREHAAACCIQQAFRRHVLEQRRLAHERQRAQREDELLSQIDALVEHPEHSEIDSWLDRVRDPSVGPLPPARAPADGVRGGLGSPDGAVAVEGATSPAFAVAGTLQMDDTRGTGSGLDSSLTAGGTGQALGAGARPGKSGTVRPADSGSGDAPFRAGIATAMGATATPDGTATFSSGALGSATGVDLVEGENGFLSSSLVGRRSATFLNDAAGSAADRESDSSVDASLESLDGRRPAAAESDIGAREKHAVGRALPGTTHSRATMLQSETHGNRERANIVRRLDELRQLLHRLDVTPAVLGRAGRAARVAPDVLRMLSPQQRQLLGEYEHLSRALETETRSDSQGDLQGTLGERVRHRDAVAGNDAAELARISLRMTHGRASILGPAGPTHLPSGSAHREAAAELAAAYGEPADEEQQTEEDYSHWAFASELTKSLVKANEDRNAAAARRRAEKERRKDPFYRLELFYERVRGLDPAVAPPAVPSSIEKCEDKAPVAAPPRRRGPVVFLWTDRPNHTEPTAAAAPPALPPVAKPQTPPQSILPTHTRFLLNQAIAAKVRPVRTQRVAGEAPPNGPSDGRTPVRLPSLNT